MILPLKGYGAAWWVLRELVVANVMALSDRVRCGCMRSRRGELGRVECASRAHSHALRLVRAVALGAVRQSVGRGRAHVVSVGIEYISNVNTLRRAKIRCEASFGTYSHTYSTLKP